ncbi:MAG: guanylate kinase [Hyphomicrobiaceae bacterium]
MSRHDSEGRQSIARRGLILILSSPSGAGKTTLARRLLMSDPKVRLSVSLTTRPPRPGEVNGEDYRFVDIQEFNRRRDQGELLEWAEVFGHSYGTPAAPVESMMADGFDVMFDIDWQGAQQIAEKVGADLVRVFILPPTGRVLEKRLQTRAQDSQIVVSQRMARAADEISHWGEYDYVIINDDLDHSEDALHAILMAERHRRERLIGLPAFVRNLQDTLE